MKQFFVIYAIFTALLITLSFLGYKAINPSTARAQTSFEVIPIYYYPSDLAFKQRNIDALKEGAAQIQSWYMKSTEGYTFDYAQPVAVKANHDLNWFKCGGSACVEESVRWNLVKIGLAEHGYQSCVSGKIYLVVMEGAGGFAGGGWCGAANSGGLALVGTWTYESHYGDYKCFDFVACNTGAAWGAAAHELGHAFGMTHTFDKDPSCPSIMSGPWGFPSVGLCSSSLVNEVAYLKSLSYFTDKRIADSTKPTVTLTSPVNSSTISGYVPLTASASDNSKIQRVEYYIDGVQYAMNVSTFNNNIYPTLARPDGAHTFEAKAYDYAGNTASSAVNVTFANGTALNDSEFPTGNITDPVDNSSVVGKIVNFTANVADNIAVERVYFGQHWQIIKEIVNPTITPSTTIDFTKEYNGIHTLNLRVVDRRGYITPYINIHVSNYSDSIVPTVSWQTPAADTTVRGSQRLEILASDDSANIPKASFYLDGSLLGDGTPTYTGSKSFYLDLDTTSVSNGTHKLKAAAFDFAGNEGYSEVNATINNSPDTANPTVSITSPAGSSSLPKGKNWSLTIKANATDDVGIKKVEISVNGVLKATLTKPITGNSYEITLSSSNFIGGTNTITATAYDLDNKSSTNTVSVSKGGRK